jgi:hypothetical protein
MSHNNTLTLVLPFDVIYNLYSYCSRGESVRLRSVKIKEKVIGEVGGVIDKKAFSVHPFNIISQRQYFVARCLISYVGNVFGLHSL